MTAWEAILGGLIGVLAGMLANELFAWQPRLARWILEKAVKRTPEAMQARLREEWQADLATIPGKLSCVVFAVSLLWEARSIEVEVAPQPLLEPIEFWRLSYAVLDLHLLGFDESKKKTTRGLLSALDWVLERADGRIKQGAYGASDRALITATAYLVKRLVRYCEDELAKEF
jgi:hypothetical protein